MGHHYEAPPTIRSAFSEPSYCKVRIGDARIRVLFGVLRYLVVLVLLGASFIDIFVKGSFPPEHRIELYNSVLVLIITTLITREGEQKLEEQENDVFKTVTSAEGVHSAPRLIGLSRQATIPSKSDGVVLVTTKV